MDRDHTAIPDRAGRTQWIGLAALSLAVMVYVMDLTVLHLAVPRLSADLRPTSAELLWIIDVYGFVVAGALITMGTLGDRVGRRKLLMIGAASFAVVSVLAAFSISSGMLIATRALMGLAGATLAPSTLSLIFVMFRDTRQRGFAIGVWIASFSAGSAVGPVFGGMLIEHYWWGSVFLLAVPIMAVLLVLGPRILPEYKDPDAGKLDLASAGISLLAVLAGIFAMKEIAQDGFGMLPAAAFGVGVMLAVIFVRRQKSLVHPLVDPRLFSAPGFMVALTTNASSIFIIVGYFLFVAQYLQLVVGLSPFQAGLWSVPSAVGYIIGSTVSPRFIYRVRPGVLIAMCMSGAALGLALLTRVGIWGDLGVIVPASVLISMSLSPVFNLTTEMIVASAPPEKAGLASGISETATELGGSLGLAVLGSIGTAVYRAGVSSDLPDGTEPKLADAMRDTLGGAADAVRDLPVEVGGPLLEIAQSAFAQGLQVAAATSALIAVIVAVSSGLMFRKLKHRSGGTHGRPGLEENPAEA